MSMEFGVLVSILVAVIGSGVAIYLARANRDSLVVGTAKQVTEMVRVEMKRLEESLARAHQRIAILEAELNRTEEATAKALKLASEATAEALRLTSTAAEEALKVSTAAATTAEGRVRELRDEIAALRAQLDQR